MFSQNEERGEISYNIDDLLKKIMICSDKEDFFEIMKEFDSIVLQNDDSKTFSSEPIQQISSKQKQSNFSNELQLNRNCKI